MLQTPFKAEWMQYVIHSSENLLLIPVHQITPEPFPAEMVVFRQNITAIIYGL